MTRVEKLRESVLRSIGDYKAVHAQATLDEYVTKLLDFLISAAEAQGIEKGRAEGAEQERKKAKREFEKLYGPVVEIHNIYGSEGNTSWVCSAPPVFAPKEGK